MTMTTDETNAGWVRVLSPDEQVYVVALLRKHKSAMAVVRALKAEGRFCPSRTKLQQLAKDARIKLRIGRPPGATDLKPRKLSQARTEVLALKAQGLDDAQIADLLGKRRDQVKALAAPRPSDGAQK